MTIQITSNDIKFMDVPEFPVRLLHNNYGDPCVICGELVCTSNCNADEWFITGIQFEAPGMSRIFYSSCQDYHSPNYR